MPRTPPRTAKSSSILTSLSALALLALVSAGCGGSSSEPGSGGASRDRSASGAATSSGVPAAAMAEARTIFDQRCVSCHGDDGTGNGPAAAALNPKPRNYQDADWQASITDEQIEKAIVGGGPAVGLSPLMPPNPDLKTKPEVVAGLREIVRGFAD